MRTCMYLFVSLCVCVWFHDSQSSTTIEDSISLPLLIKLEHHTNTISWMFYHLETSTLQQICLVCVTWMITSPIQKVNIYCERSIWECGMGNWSTRRIKIMVSISWNQRSWTVNCIYLILWSAGFFSRFQYKWHQEIEKLQLRLMKGSCNVLSSIISPKQEDIKE